VSRSLEILSGVPLRQPEGTAMSRETVPRQLHHLVFGGELTGLDAVAFEDLDELDIVHLHRLLAPDAVGASPPH
jgi:hypothetical protein